MDTDAILARTFTRLAPLEHLRVHLGALTGLGIGRLYLDDAMVSGDRGLRVVVGEVVGVLTGRELEYEHRSSCLRRHPPPRHILPCRPEGSRQRVVLAERHVVTIVTHPRRMKLAASMADLVEPRIAARPPDAVSLDPAQAGLFADLVRDFAVVDLAGAHGEAVYLSP